MVTEVFIPSLWESDFGLGKRFAGKLSEEPLSVDDAVRASGTTVTAPASVSTSGASVPWCTMMRGQPSSSDPSRGRDSCSCVSLPAASAALICTSLMENCPIQSFR